MPKQNDLPWAPKRWYPDNEDAIRHAIDNGCLVYQDDDYRNIVDFGYVAVDSSGTVRTLRRVELHYEWQMPL